MGSGTEILVSQGRLSQAGPDPRRWAALLVMLLAAGVLLLSGALVLLLYPLVEGQQVGWLASLLMLARSARRRHSAGPVAV